MAKDWDDVKPVRFMSNRVEQHFGYKSDYAVRILKNVMNEEEKIEPYKHELRVSKLPYCGLLDTVEQLEKPARKSKYGLGFYTSIGTAVHENLQNLFASSKKFGGFVIGRWQCSRCKFIVQEVGPMPFEGICPKCRPNEPTLQYHELDFKYRNKISAHMDQLTRDNKEHYAGWEYKTTSEANIRDPSKYLPYKKHIIQIETYMALLQHQYGITCKAFFIVYLNRNKVQDENKASEFVVFGFKVKQANLDKRLAHLDYVVESDKITTKLLKTKNEKYIKELEAIRPCRSEEQYKDFMAHHFFGREKCPFFRQGKCFHDGDSGTQAGKRIAKLLK